MVREAFPGSFDSTLGARGATRVSLKMTDVDTDDGDTETQHRPQTSKTALFGYRLTSAEQILHPAHRKKNLIGRASPCVNLARVQDDTLFASLAEPFASLTEPY